MTINATAATTAANAAITAANAAINASTGDHQELSTQTDDRPAPTMLVELTPTLQQLRQAM